MGGFFKIMLNNNIITFNAVNKITLLQTADGTQQKYHYNLVLQPIGLTTTFSDKTQIAHIKSLDKANVSLTFYILKHLLLNVCLVHVKRRELV
jgi:hypothetical protein